MLAASPAAAQPWGPYGPRAYAPAVSPHELHATLRAHGLRPITQPVLSGYYLVVRAVDGYGDVVRVLVNARYGNIVSIAPLPPAPVLGERSYRSYEPYRPYQPYPRYGAVRPDLKTEPAPLVGTANGPGAIANAHQPAGMQQPAGIQPPAAMQQPAAVTATRTPLPRPRPTLPSTAAVVNAAPESGAAAIAAPTTTGSVPNTRSGSSFPPAAPLE
jgi:hypothetical protein